MTPSVIEMDRHPVGDACGVGVACHHDVVTLVIAHRGASRAEPENTIRAFERAVEMGADGVELDVRRTVDDHLVVHHDAHLPDGRAICHTARADLPASIPELTAALDACAGIAVNIEIKNDPRDPDHDPSDRVVERVARDLGPGSARWLVSSFRWETVVRCRELLPDVRTAFLTSTLDPDTIDRTAALGHDAIHPWDRVVDEAAIRHAHSLGLAVNVWTCDDPDRMRDLMAWGVDGICTNVPDVALEVRRR